MPKRILLSLFIAFQSMQLLGQNLVPNGSFEQYVGCPDSWSMLDSCLNWFNPTAATPDYYNQCSNQIVGVPNNDLGYRIANSGVGYAGLIQRASNSTWREYIEIQLSAPLVAGLCYNFEMYVGTPGISQFKSYAIGVYFSDSLYTNFQTTEVLPLVPQINNTPGNVPNISNWMKVSGNYVSTGGENYLIIGNFNDSANSPLTNSHANILFPFAYVYIDDVSLSLSSCTALEEPYETEDLNIYPNPFSNRLSVTTNINELVELNLFDKSARKIISQSFTESSTIITEQLAKGIYYYEVSNKYGVIKKGKIVKN